MCCFYIKYHPFLYRSTMKNGTLFICFFILFQSVYSQKLILEDAVPPEKSKPGDGIWVEIPDYKDTFKHKYSIDNISFKLGSLFIYDYYFIDRLGIKRKFLLSTHETDVENPLNITTYVNSPSNAIDKILLTVTDLRETYPQCDSACTQTTITYSYLKKAFATDTGCIGFNRKGYTNISSCGAVSTGVVDNKKNVWIHPPRQYTFKILQLNPFPFYVRDESVKEWSWNVVIGDKYLDERWLNQKKKFTMRFNYKREKDEILSTSFGQITCKVTTATGTADFGPTMKTMLKSYYQDVYGFIRLEYINIDQTKIIFQLIEKFQQK